WIGGLVVLLVGLFVAFLPLYIRFPDSDVTLREAVPGAGVVAIGWVGLQAAFQGYASLAAGGDLYGVLGGVLLLVTWFYLAAMLILLGAVFNVVLAARDGDRQGQKPGGRED
ncbi:MAG: YhjD/YihY/BrkB family envelope integrity protein, partial [Halobacteriales archaeon]